MLPSPRTTPTVSHKHSVQTQSPRVAGSRRADSGLGWLDFSTPRVLMNGADGMIIIH